MILADSGYPLLDLMWTMCIFFGWILWFWLLIAVYSDVFRRKDIGAGAKTLWVVFTLVLPFLGALTYLITQGRSMAERGEQRAQAQRAAMDDYVRSVAVSGNGAAGRQRGLSREPGRPARRRQEPARQRRHHPGGVRGSQAQGARLSPR